jgi:hypothetical protein
MKYIIQGLKVSTTREYIKFTIDREVSIKEDLAGGYIEIRFPKGFRSSQIHSKHIEYLYDVELVETEFIKMANPIIDLNGVRFKKLSSPLLNWNQFLVENIKDFVLEFSEGIVTILVPTERKDDLCTYIKCLSMIPMIEVIDCPELCELNNIFSLNIGNRSLRVDSDDKFIYNSKEFYEQYILKGVDVLHSFLSKLKGVLLEKSIQLVGFPISEKASSPNQVTYKTTELDKQVSRKSDFIVLKEAIQKMAKIDFTFNTPNMIMFFDIRNRYQNLDYISNIGEFHTKDKFGNQWVSAIKWEEMPADYSPEYAQDSKGNFSYECKFSCELHYYVVYDVVRSKISEIVSRLITSDVSGENAYSQIDRIILKIQ